VVAALKMKYQPVDMVSMVEMRQALSAMSIKKDEDPSSMFEHICGIDNRFQRAAIALTEEEKIATILLAALKEYVTLHCTRLVVSLQAIVNTKGSDDKV
jgi:hypothetical protein